MAVSEHDRAAAEQLAREVAASTGSRRTWRKVTTLLDLFDVYRFTDSVRGRIGEALDEAGLIADPPIAEVERYAHVRLSLREPAPGAAPATNAMTAGAVDASHWLAGRGPTALADLTRRPDSGVLWLDIDITGLDDPAQLHAALVPLCGDELTVAMLGDLLVVDDRPHVQHYENGVRNVSSFSVIARDSEEDAADPERSPSARRPARGTSS